MAKDKGEESDKVKRADSITDVQYSGWLKKKSPKKYIGLQVTQQHNTSPERLLLKMFMTSLLSSCCFLAAGSICQDRKQFFALL